MAEQDLGLGDLDEEQYILDAYASYLDVEAINSRRRAQFDKANCYAELAYQLRRGRVLLSGELKMMECLYKGRNR